jgi:hypothetical protein
LFTVQEGGEIERLARAAGVNSVVSKNQAASKLILQAQALLASIEQEHDPAKLPNASRGLDTRGLSYIRNETTQRPKAA